MDFHGVDIRCPYCHGDLHRQNELPNPLLVCRACSHCYPIILGIPDLRIFADPYIDIEADRKKGLLVGSRMEDLSFGQLVDYYYSITPAVPPAHAERYKRGLMIGVPRASGDLSSWEAMARPSNSGALLEVGCGTGALLVAAHSRFSRVAGVDISFRWLVVAKRRLSEAGMTAPLICACAEALPFAPEQFDTVALQSALETVQDQRKVVRECRRLLRPSGHICISTPNRYSLGPDPHIGVLAGGWLPDRWVEAYARKHGAVPPKRNLLSAKSLRTLLEDAGFRDIRIDVPEVAREQRRAFGFAARTLIAGYHASRHIPVTKAVLELVGPLLHAVANKPSKKLPAAEHVMHAAARAAL
jgi:ubiquinone/menaquinone biosynthesis C-methylase UbiE/uncharacterized protein YbaR (Trm112 family)